MFHFKKPIFIINTSRGKTVQTQAVLNGIKQGKILGAGLDVLEVEKFPVLAEQQWFKELQQSRKVILTPHVAGSTREAVARAIKQACDNVLRVAAGDPPLNAVT